MTIFVDPESRTFLYTMHVESLWILSERSELIGRPLECQWQSWGCKHRSSPFTVKTAEPTQMQYDAFFAVSFPDVNERSLLLKLALVPAGSASEGIMAQTSACLDLATFSIEESFRVHTVEFRKGGEVVAMARLYTASQPRWTVDAPVTQEVEGCWLYHDQDPQADYIRSHIGAEAIELASQGEDGLTPKARRCAARSPDSCSRSKPGTEAPSRELDTPKPPTQRRVSWSPQLQQVEEVSCASSNPGFFERVQVIFSCVQEQFQCVQQMASCSSEQLSCQCTSREEWEKADLKQPRSPPGKAATIEEEGIDSIFYPPLVAAALAKADVRRRSEPNATEGLSM